MKPSDQDKLLRELLAGDALDQRRASSLAAMLGAVQRRRQRQALLTSGAATLMLAFSIALVIQRRAGEPAPVISKTTPPKAPAVATISDEQLLALFADRGVALVGRAGAQQLLFLDAPPARTATGEKPLSLNR